MLQKNYYKNFSVLLIILSISSYFLGFIYGENSAGGGLVDYLHVWSNLQTFLNNSLIEGVNLTATYDDNTYMSSRTPLLYIIHKLFNPFTENEIFFKRSVFLISLSVPFLFFFCLKEKFKKEESLLLLLISSIIFLSPYFRTSSYWALEENYALVALLLSFLFLTKFLNNKNNFLKDYYFLLLTTFFSSACLYFDQKLTIIPLICFVQIIFSNKNLKLKSFSLFSYFIFSLPFVYLISIWGGLMPPRDAFARGIGNQVYLYHLGYALTIIAFYLLPLLLYREKGLLFILKKFFLDKKNYYLISIFFLYLIYLLFLHDYNNERVIGKGFIHKTAILLFKDIILQKIFIYISFFISWIIILIYLSGSLKNKLILFYFFILSIFIFPLMQEYFDPIIILMAFTFLNSKFLLSYRSSIFLFFYLSILLIFSNIYYYNLSNV